MNPLSRIFKTTVVAGALAAVCALIQPAAADSRPDMVIAVNKLPRSLEPAMKMGNVDVRVNYNIFDTLIRRNFKNEDGTGETFLPGLATSWKRISPTTMELELRQGVTFHDGSPFTADDVIFSFGKERIYGEKAPVQSAALFIGDLDRIEKLGLYKIRIVMKAPDPIIEHRLAGYASWIVSRKAYEKFKTDGEPAEKWMQTAIKKVTWNPVGTGPFKFKEYVPGDRVSLTANDGYFGGKPQAKSVTFKEVPEVATRLAGLVSGEFDMVVEIPPDQMPVLDKYSDIKPASVVLENSHVLTFNTKHPVMQDRKLRQALTLAIDRKKLIETLWRGKTITPNGNQMPNFGEYFIKDFPPFPYDPAQARKLLAESSYKGQEIEYRLIPNYYTNSMEAAQIIQEMWKEIGFNMSWGPGSEIQEGKNAYWDGTPEFNKLAGVLTGSVDKPERKQAFRRMMEIYREEAPGTILYNPISTYAVRKGIEFTPYSLYYMDLRADNLKIARSN